MRTRQADRPPEAASSRRGIVSGARKAVWWALAAVVVVLVFVLAAKRGRGVGADSGVPSGKRPKTELNKPSKTKTSTAPTNVGTNDSLQTAEVEALQETWLGQPVVKHEHRTNGTLIVETIYTSDGKKHKYYHDERENALPTGADQMLAMMTANNGYGAPPLPKMANFEDDFADALKIPIEIRESDGKAAKELKERVIAARKEMLDLMAEGYSADEVIRDWEKMQEDNATVRMDAVRKVKELLAEGDREGAQILCDEYNEVLEKAGIMTIELPPER